jgi:hypothetical protein
MHTLNSSIQVQDHSQDNAREALLSRVLSPSPVFTLHGRDDPERDSVEKFVAMRFFKDYGADIHEFMPDLLSMRCLNCFSGVIGMRRAATSKLFLEQYLDNAIEEVLSGTTGADVGRREIIEIGNLVAGRKGPSQFVFLIATSMLHEAGYKWITFTATRTLANNLNKLGFHMVKLADASLDRLPQGAAGEWGSYYRTQPCVYAGSLDGAMAIARRRPLFRKAMAMYRRCIRKLAKEFNGA